MVVDDNASMNVAPARALETARIHADFNIAAARRNAGSTGKAEPQLDVIDVHESHPHSFG